jgi:hypothetical protein
MAADYCGQISPAAAHPHQFNGKQFARQYWETVDQFLQRLPPATTEGSRELQWIWISNPHVPPPQFDPDGIPRDEWMEHVSKIPTLRMHGRGILHHLEMTKFALEQNIAQLSAAIVTRQMCFERDIAVAAIHHLAITMEMTTGKVRSLIHASHSKNTQDTKQSLGTEFR